MQRNIPYQSFCWVLGTTSFRTAQLNLRIEQMLMLLRSFKAEVLARGQDWCWESNEELQEEFYEHMLAHDALSGEATRKAKDARQKTSGLVTLGLATSERTLTDVGLELLAVTDSRRYDRNNLFQIPSDSFIYLKQLLKASVTVSEGAYVRPFMVLAYLLNEFGHLTYDEFSVLLPLVVDDSSLETVCEGIGLLRSGEGTVDEVLWAVLMSKGNYRDAHQLWMKSEVTLDVVTTIGMNRKSRNYDKAYLPLFEALEQVFLADYPGNEAVVKLHDAVRSISGTAGALWRKVLFAGASSRAAGSKGLKAVPETCPYRSVRTMPELKEQFFRDLHLHKALATLSDYFDLNRRYFKLTDAVLFEDSRVVFDTVPRAYFSLKSSELISQLFCPSDSLERSTSLAEVSPGLAISEVELLAHLSEVLGTQFDSVSGVREWLRDERYDRLAEILDTRFTRDVLLELLDCFERRDDKRIAELVTPDATPSTIFEYIVGLIWYDISEREGDILDYMKLQLEADLMPRTHAQGGTADIIYEYRSDLNFVPKHDLLIEVTLADGSNERQMEMEPVSRHLGNHRLATGNSNDYCLFIAPNLDINVVNDFRHRKIMGFFDPISKDKIDNMKIIPIDVGDLREILTSGRRYKEIYGVFDEAFELSELSATTWQEQLKCLLHDG